MTQTRTPQAHRTRVREDIIAPWPAQAMLGLLDRDPRTLAVGDPLPLGWHWLYFKQPLRASDLGTDGHERRGAFMPEVDLPRRMWAGGTLRALRPARIGGAAELRSEIGEVKEKRGRSGRLVFVTVRHALVQDGRACVEEDQVIVYRQAGPRVATGVLRPQPAPPQPPVAIPEPTPEWRESFLPTRVTLFQFSALTYNGHRIHYDHPYVTEREGYRDLLVHGPLTALLLLDAVRRHTARPVSRFRYRALAPLYVGQPITLAARSDAAGASNADRAPATPPPDERIVEALRPDGTVAMRGWVA